jgi:hypothetical protein
LWKKFSREKLVYDCKKISKANSAYDCRKKSVGQI